jgi:hypothetical protein
VDSDCKLAVSASLTTTTNYSKSPTIITAQITLKPHLIFTLRELPFLPTSRLPWPMPEVLASTDFSSTSLYLDLDLDLLNCSSRRQIYFTTDGQSASLSWYQATIWDQRPIFLSPPHKLSLDSWAVVILGRPLG